MSTSDLSRREFLEMSGLAAFSGLAPGGSATLEAEAGWFDRPMRWAQLTLVEDDPARYDPQFWLDYFKRIHADAACLSAGGCVAYYPTKIRLHYRSAWMGDSDPFGKLVSGCRTLDMIVIARTDPHAAHQEDRKSTRLNSSHLGISYAVFCLKKKMVTVINSAHVH